MVDNTPKDLGLGRSICRRDFLNGAAVAVGALGLGAAVSPASAAAPIWPQDVPGYYPPVKTGLRGSHPGSFESAHARRDGGLSPETLQIQDTGEAYDLIIVGAGMSGLAAAYFYRAERPNAKILILDNHDDFGGHAKRNQFNLGGRLDLVNGGTLEIDSPRPYSAVADGLLKALGVFPTELAKTHEFRDLYEHMGLSGAVFFDKETFGQDKLAVGAPRNDSDAPDAKKLSAFLAQTPLSEATRNIIRRIETGEGDFYPGLTSAQKKDRLSRISYRQYIADAFQADPLTLAFYQAHTHGEWGVGVDAVSALDCWGFGMPGFDGLKLDPGSAPRMSFTPAGYADGGSYKFHFPDGNASLARLLVRSLVPGALSGSAAEDIVTATADYSRLDAPEQNVRIRLSSTVIRAQNLGDPKTAKQVEILYMRGGDAFRVTGGAVILASWNMMIPYLVPDLPEAQKAALHDLVKTPLVYTSVAIRNWTAFKKLGVASIHAPGGYHSRIKLNPPTALGGYHYEADPEKPIMLQMVRTPCKPGLSEHEQNRAGRAELLGTSFETFERNIREQLGRTLGAGGFDPAGDITAITVNRWPHGYAPERNPLWEDPETPEALLPQTVGRQRFGRIAIANSDCGGGAYTNVAIDQGYRAVGEILS